MNHNINMEKYSTIEGSDESQHGQHSTIEGSDESQHKHGQHSTIEGSVNARMYLRIVIAGSFDL
jgi:hypothetical protein